MNHARYATRHATRHAIVGAFFSLLLLASLAGCSGRSPFDRRALIVFVNQSECGEIPVQLTNRATGEIKKVSLLSGATLEIEVTPEVNYRYLIDFSATARTADNFKCTGVEQGDVSVPAGTRQTFNLASRKQTPAASVSVTPNNVIPEVVAATPVTSASATPSR